MTATLAQTEREMSMETPEFEPSKSGQSMSVQKEREEYCLGSLDQIPPGEGRRFRVAGRDIAVYHTRQGMVHATQADCPHRNGPLSDGLLGGSQLVCPLHAWKWDLNTGKPLFGDCALTIYPVRLTSQREIWVEGIGQEFAQQSGSNSQD